MSGARTEVSGLHIDPTGGLPASLCPSHFGVEAGVPWHCLPLGSEDLCCLCASDMTPPIELPPDASNPFQGHCQGQHNPKLRLFPSLWKHNRSGREPGILHHRWVVGGLDHSHPRGRLHSVLCTPCCKSMPWWGPQWQLCGRWVRAPAGCYWPQIRLGHLSLLRSKPRHGLWGR